MLRLAFVLGISLAVSGAQAQQGVPVEDFMTGNRLLLLCGSGSAYDQRECFGYLEGISDATQRGAVNSFTCIVQGVVAAQIRDITVQFLQSHINMRQYAAAGLAAVALSEAFPCS